MKTKGERWNINKRLPFIDTDTDETVGGVSYMCKYCTHSYWIKKQTKNEI